MTVKNGGEEKPKPRILIRPRVPGAAKPEPDRIPADAATRLEKKSDQAMRPTIKPPPRPQQEQAPVSIRTAESDGPITGTENTVAAPSVPSAQGAPAPAEEAKASRRPPPPPPPHAFKATLQNVSVACDQLIHDERLDERAKANALAKLYDGQFRIDPDNPNIRALEAGAKRHGEELDRLVRGLGNDKQKLMKAQESARARWEQGGAGMDEQGYKIIELLYTKMAIEALSGDGTDGPEQKKEKEGKLARFDDYIKKKLGVTGTLKPLEEYLFGLLKLRSAAEKAAKDADEYDRINNIKRSRRYSQRIDGDKSPGKGVERPQKPPAVAADEPAFVASADGRRLSKPPEPEQKPSNRPSAMYRNQPEPGFVRRMFSDPMFWTLGGVTAFTSALLYKDSFREMAQALRMLWRDTLQRPDFEFTRLQMVLGYAGVMALGLGLSILLRRREVRKKALKYEELSEGSRKEREKKDRVISKLTRISLDHDKFEDQITNLRQALLQDAQFMSDLYDLKKHRFFNEMLAEARVHPKLVQNLNIIFERVKVEKLQKRLNKMAELLDQPEQRCGLFKDYCLKDPIFAMMIHEIFERRGGNYVNIDKQNAAFHEVLNEKDENVGPQLLKALKDDFESFRDEV